MDALIGDCHGCSAHGRQGIPQFKSAANQRIVVCAGYGLGARG